MLRLPAFRLDQPASLAEAAAILAGEGPAARVVAGGTDLLPNLKRRHQKAERIVSLAGIAALRGVAANGGVTIGAMERLADLEAHPALAARFPGLASAIASISSPPLRALGTLGGNVCLDTRCTYYDQTEEWRRSIAYCMKAEGTVCWVAPSSPRCWAVQSADSAPMLVALGATARLVSSAGEREMPVEALYRDDGIEYLTKRPEEIVAAIHLPAEAAADRLRTAFFKLRRRGSIDFGVLSVAVALQLRGDVVERAAIVLGSIASLPSRAGEAERELEGKPLSEETIRAAAEKSRGAATPMDNTDLDPRWRGQVTPVYVARTLRAAAEPPATS
jgi:4-hydroxybenzoyl-CoA reductase subunit beta